MILTHRLRNNFAVATQMATSSSMVFPLGACVTAGGKVLSRGKNDARSRMSLPSINTQRLNIEPQMKASCGRYHCASLHAEISALKGLFPSYRKLPCRERKDPRKVAQEP